MSKRELALYISQIYISCMKDFLNSQAGFDWDDGNREKNQLKHNVSTRECEEIFFNQPLIILDDHKHSKEEQRYVAYGATDEGRKLHLIFTVRESKFRVISARDMHRKERAFYEN